MIPTPPPVGIEDHVRRPPAELLDDLVAHRLLALDPVRLLAAWTRPGSPRAPSTAALISAPASPIRPSTRYSSAPATTHSRRVIDRRVHRHGDQRPQPGAGGVGGPRRAGVAVGRHRDARDAQLRGPRHPDRRAARLERRRSGRGPRPSSAAAAPRAGRRGAAGAAAASCPRPASPRGRGPERAAARGSATGPARRAAIVRRRDGRGGPFEVVAGQQRRPDARDVPCTTSASWREPSREHSRWDRAENTLPRVTQVARSSTV